MIPSRAGLSRDLVGRVLAGMGLARPPEPGLAGLREIYGAWCASVPFDNVRKLVAVHSGPEEAFPGGEAEDFFENWLEHGVGGTCWPTSNALFELLDALGFQARRVAGSMRDTGAVSHGSVKVRIGGADWLVDSSMLTGAPLPLGERVFVHDDPVFAAQVEPVDGTHLLWFELPPGPSWMPCRLLLDPVDHGFYLQAYEASRGRSPFNQRLYARRNRGGALCLLSGSMRIFRTARGIESRELTPAALCRALREDIGLSQGLIERWAGSGALEASFQPPSGPNPPPASALPPSLR